jgi:fatty acid desaturase
MDETEGPRTDDRPSYRPAASSRHRRDALYGGRIIFARFAGVAVWIGAAIAAVEIHSAWPFVVALVVQLLVGIFVVLCDIAANQGKE